MCQGPPDIKVIFAEAIKKATAEELTSYLDQVCGTDMALRAEVESLLASHRKAGTFLAGLVPEQDIGHRKAMTESPGTTMGPYKLLHKIGEGGMAVVYLAQQERPIQRDVAIKIIKLGMDTQQVIARFDLERQALAMMDHPNIAKVLDAGSTQTGRPYFVMEFVDGTSITEYSDNKNLSTNERLGLFISVCNAVQHAHQKGIIHRDIKPSNVLVTVQDGKAVPKVIDFGIAKATDKHLTEKTVFTQHAQLIGTPEYMSPEQAGADGIDIDTRTDVYSLGVLLYELLTGVKPFDAKTLREAGYGEIQRMIREEDPLKPSTRLSTLGDPLTAIAHHRRTNPETLSRLLRRDLDWIVMKALEKDRVRRYQTATDFGADILRFLSNEPVMAAAPSVRYKVSKFIKRHRMGFFTGIVVVVALAFSVIVLLHSYYQTTLALNEVDQQRERAEQILRFLLADHDTVYLDGKEVLTETLPSDTSVSANQLITYIYQPGPEQGKDVFVDNQFPDINQDGLPLFIGPKDKDPSTMSSALIRFDLTDLPAENVISAKLRLHRSGDEAYCATSATAYRIVEAWEEDTITYRSRPGTSKYELSSVYIDATDRWYEWDITRAYRDWQSGKYPNYGVELRYDYIEDGETFQFHSSDSISHRPILEIHAYVGKPPVTVVCQPGPEEGKDTFENAGSPDNEALRDLLVVRPKDGKLYNGLRSLIQFDLNGLPMENVISAKLKLYNLPHGTGGPANVSAHRIVDPWEEDLVAEGEGFPHEDVPLDSVYIDETDRWYEWDITETYVAWQEGRFPNYGIKLIDFGSENGQRHAFTFASSDWPSYRPILEITAFLIETPGAFVMALDSERTQDAFVDSRHPDQNAGGFYLSVGPGDGIPTKKAYSLIQFDLSDLPAEDVLSAKLRLFMISGSGISCDVTAHRILEDWHEHTVTYNNQPPIKASALDRTCIDMPERWYEWDITEAYVGWQEGRFPNYGIELRHGFIENGECFIFGSSDWAFHHPILEITVDVDGRVAQGNEPKQQEEKD